MTEIDGNDGTEKVNGWWTRFCQIQKNDHIEEEKIYQNYDAIDYEIAYKEEKCLH